MAAKFNYYLKDKNTKGETMILLVISWNNDRLKFPIRETINPVYWDFNDKFNRVIQKKGNPDFKEKVRKLSNYLAKANDLFTRFENDNNRQPQLREFKQILEKEFFGLEEIEVDYSLINFVDKFIHETKFRTNKYTGKPIAKGTLLAYNHFRNMLAEYSKKKIKKLTFDDIDMDFFYGFVEFGTANGLKPSTLSKRIIQLKTILREATERGLNNKNTYLSKKFNVKGEPFKTIYLNDSELMELFKLDLSENKRLDKVRDLFLVGCYTGLRFSDLSVLTEKNIIDDFIEIETQKTREAVAIPLHPIVRHVLKKYNGGLPRAVSNQKMNEYLKEIGQMIENLNEVFSRTMTKGGKEITINSKRYLQVSTHTARRSFASNLFVKGVPSQTIMKITGHKTEKSFMQYIKITPKENAKLIQMIWDKESKLSIVS
jgi:integrase